MSAQQSYLSHPNYGHDMVISVTQKSVNQALKQFLKGLPSEETTYCYVYVNKEPVLTDYPTFLNTAGVSDLFNYPTNDYDPDSEIGKADDNNFAFAFRASLGLSDADIKNLPEIIKFDKGTSTVTYQLYFKTCSLLDLRETNHDTVLKWTNLAQSPDNPWIVSMNVNIGFKTIEFESLPASTQRSITAANSNTAFSVGQLYLDLNTATLSDSLAIDALDPTDPDTKQIIFEMGKIFFEAYLKNLSKGAVTLGYTVKPLLDDRSGQFGPTNFDLGISPNLFPSGLGNPAKLDLYTLNYLIATDNHDLQTPLPFAWNWLDDTAQDTSFDGVISLNRNTLRDHLKMQVDQIVPGSCLIPGVKVSLDSLSRPQYSFPVSTGGSPTVNLPATGKTVLSYTWNPGSAHDEAGAGGGIGQATIQPSYTCTMDFVGNTIVINQHLIVYAWIKHLATAQGGNVIDKSISDTYTFSIDPITFKIRMTQVKSVADNSQSPKANGFLDFFTGINELVDKVTSWLNGFVSSCFTDIPLSAVQGVCFPGGNSFTLKDVFFSDYQDLVSHITYADTAFNPANDRVKHLANMGIPAVATTAIMRDDGFNPTEVATAISGRWNLNASQTMDTMKQAGYPLIEFSEGILNVFNIDVQVAANTFKQYNYPPLDVARDLKDVFGKDLGFTICIMDEAGYALPDIHAATGSVFG